MSALDGDALRLEGDEAKHLVKSLRLRAGDAFVATDGRGTVARLVAEAIDRRGIDARVAARARVEPPALRLWLCAEAEGSRADWIVEKAAELGAWAFCPREDPGAGQRARWERLATAALKQSLGAWTLQVPPHVAPLERARAGGFAWIGVALPGGVDPLAQALPAHGEGLLVSGPPGGFPAAEEAAWRALPGAVALDLGPRRLRAETAALALLVSATVRARSATRGSGETG